MHRSSLTPGTDVSPASSATTFPSTLPSLSGVRSRSSQPLAPAGSLRERGERSVVRQCLEGTSSAGPPRRRHLGCSTVLGPARGRQGHGAATSPGREARTSEAQAKPRHGEAQARSKRGPSEAQERGRDVAKPTLWRGHHVTMGPWRGPGEAHDRPPAQKRAPPDPPRARTHLRRRSSRSRAAPRRSRPRLSNTPRRKRSGAPPGPRSRRRGTVPSIGKGVDQGGGGMCGETPSL